MQIKLHSKNKHPLDFEHIYNMYWEKVFLLCYHSLNNKEIAQDLTQDIFRSLWEKRERLEIKSSIEGYLVQSAKYKVIEYVRSEITNRKYNDTVLKENEVITSNSPEEEYTHSELNFILKRLISTLPQQCKKVFTLSRLKGQTNREIANALEISERAVEYHITKALSFIRKNLSNYTNIFTIFLIFTCNVS